MRILITGAAGFIGRQLVSALAQAGHDVICAVRQVAKARHLLPGYPLLACDFNQDTDPAVWRSRLHDIDVVINCAGVLQPRRGESITHIHELTPKALFRAAQDCGVKKVIQISAQGADADANTLYGRSKAAADAYLQTLDLDWSIVKPSLVYGSGSYGGTSLFRGLAGLPGIMPLVGLGRQVMQPIHIEDLAQSVVALVETTQPLHQILHAGGPEVKTLREILVAYRAWLGFGWALLVPIPACLILWLMQLANVLSRGPASTTAIKMLQTTQVVDTQPYFRAIHFIPRSFSEGLALMPSYVQDRWHARLYFIVPLLRWSLGLMWLLSGLIPLLLLPHEQSYALLAKTGVATAIIPGLFYASSLLDIGLGVATLWRWRLAWVGWIEFVLIVVYTVIISIYLPSYWLEPFGSLVKNIPVLMATLVMIATREQR